MSRRQQPAISDDDATAIDTTCLQQHRNTTVTTATAIKESFRNNSPKRAQRHFENKTHDEHLQRRNSACSPTAADVHLLSAGVPCTHRLLPCTHSLLPCTYRLLPCTHRLLACTNHLPTVLRGREPTICRRAPITCRHAPTECRLAIHGQASILAESPLITMLRMLLLGLGSILGRPHDCALQKRRTIC